MTDRPVVQPADEGRHDPGPEPLWSESWYFDFVAADGDLGGWVRIGLYPNLGVTWYHAFVCGPGRRTVAVVDTEAPLLTGPGLELRSHGLWATHVCETPLDHWSLANEAFGVTVDDPADLYASGDVRGDLVPLGLDLEWETDGEPYHYGLTTRYEIPCRVHGEVALGDERITIDGHGQRDHSWAVRDWWQFGWVWTAGRLDDGTRFHASDIRVAPDMRPNFGYSQPPDGPLVDALLDCEASEDLGEHGFPTRGEVRIGELDLEIEPLAFAPALLIGPEGQVGRFPRALCGFSSPDGRRGRGWTEWNQPQ